MGVHGHLRILVYLRCPEGLAEMTQCQWEVDQLQARWNSPGVSVTLDVCVQAIKVCHKTPECRCLHVGVNT